MSRDLTAGVETATLAEHVAVIVFAELDFASGVVRVSTAGHDVQWSGYTWSGIGVLGSIESIGESTDLYAHGCAMRLSGIPGPLLTTALTEHYQGRRARVWVAVLDAEHRIIADPYLAWDARMDVMSAELGQSATITLTTESRFADWDRPRARRYNDADQQAAYAGDRGLEYVESLATAYLVWGYPSAASAPSTAPAGSYSGLGGSWVPAAPPRTPVGGSYSGLGGSWVPTYAEPAAQDTASSFRR